MSADTKNAGEDWGDLENAPKEKRGLPRWLLFCGGGCLVAAVLVAIAGYFVVKFVGDAKNQDVQYPKLERHIALDHRLEGYELFGIDLAGSETYIFGSKDGRMATIFVADTDPERKLYEAQLDPAVNKGLGNVGAREEVEVGTIQVQGRELRIVRAIQKPIELPGQKSQKGASAYVDISPEGSVDKLYLMVSRPGNMTRITDEEIAGFLAPFRIGPGHVESKLPAESQEPGQPPTEKKESDGDH